MRVWIIVVAALGGMLLVLAGGRVLLQPPVPLITAAAFSPDRITPNADGDDDVTLFRYSLSRNAEISLIFVSETDERFIFRQNMPRIPDDYEVLFSGVVDGYVRDDENIPGSVLRRLMPDGNYTWELTAFDPQRGETDVRTGVLTIQDADSPLPEISTFTIWPDVFTPNQDGISDRTEINVYLEKAADLQVYLVSEAGEKIYVAPRQEGRKPGEAGRHLFDYEGGVDLGADPPPDGVYQVVARAQDAVGQVVERYAQLTIRNGGKPLAEIVPQTVGVDVVFTAWPYEDRYFTAADALGDVLPVPADVQDNRLTPLTMPVGDMLVFKLTVENYGKVPLRTTGPRPGTVYQQTQRAATLKAFDESGAWRVGIDCTTADSDYPWRWALGTADDLYQEYDPISGNTYSYLPPGAQVVVWGGIRLTEIEARNPQNCWAGLIHEDVEVSIRNSNVGSREVELVDPNPDR
jgi:hypothetical protein